jgi:integrase
MWCWKKQEGKALKMVEIMAPTIIASKVILDDALERFLASKKPSTSNTYRTAFTSHFIPFLGQFEFKGRRFSTFKEVVSAVKNDMSLPIDEIQLLDVAVFDGFGQYLKAKKLAPKGIVNRVGAVQSAFKFWKCPISTKDFNLPDAEAETESYDWNIPMFEKFNALLRTPRYRALDAFLFQSGLGSQDVLCRKYGEIKKQFEDGAMPIGFKLTRGKTRVKHHACIGPETIQLLRAYFDDEYGIGINPDSEAKIFPMSRRPVDDIYADRAHKLIGSWPFNNPMGPHSRRKFFRKQLVKVGKCPSEYAEHFMGHKLKDIQNIYSEMDVASWCEIYKEYGVPNLHFQILDYEKVKKELKLDAKKKV